MVVDIVKQFSKHHTVFDVYHSKEYRRNRRCGSTWFYAKSQFISLPDYNSCLCLCIQQNPLQNSVPVWQLNSSDFRPESRCKSFLWIFTFHILDNRKSILIKRSSYLHPGANSLLLFTPTNCHNYWMFRQK